jgi:hypothetical protein
MARRIGRWIASAVGNSIVGATWLLVIVAMLGIPLMTIGIFFWAVSQ